MEAWQMHPGQISGYNGLEQQAEKLSEAVRREFDQDIGCCNQLIDQDFEMSNPSFITYTNLVTTCLGLGKDESCWSDSYAGFQFGVLLTKRLNRGKTISLELERFYDAPPKDLEAKLNMAPNIYLQHRQHLDSLISQYVSDVTSRPAHWHLAAITATLACVHVEQSLFDRFVDEQASRLIRDLETDSH